MPRMRLILCWGQNSACISEKGRTSLKLTSNVECANIHLNDGLHRTTGKEKALISQGFWTSLDLIGLLLGARDRNRTGTALRPRDFKSLASTNSATRAYEWNRQYRPVFLRSLVLKPDAGRVQRAMLLAQNTGSIPGLRIKRRARKSRVPFTNGTHARSPLPRPRDYPLFPAIPCRF